MNPDRIKSAETPEETTHVNGLLYSVDRLKEYAETIPAQTVTVASLKEYVEEGQKYWLDSEGQMFGPSEILKDWEAAKTNPLWKDHVDGIENANLYDPIWQFENGPVFDGIHRLTRAVRDNLATIQVKVFKELPDSAKLDK